MKRSIINKIIQDNKIQKNIYNYISHNNTKNKANLQPNPVNNNKKYNHKK